MHQFCIEWIIERTAKYDKYRMKPHNINNEKAKFKVWLKVQNESTFSILYSKKFPKSTFRKNTWREAKQ